jgi:peptidoglycan/xylan/chitin deacetylase (PgdA/CDA1 family)
VAGAFALAARVAAAAGDALQGRRLSILIFHRVLPEPDPLFPGEMHAQAFDALCRELSGTFNVLTLCDAVRARDHGALPPRALVITFDDGYADNVDIALPILQSHGLPATFFVASGFLDGGRMWNDTVIETLRRTRVEQANLPELGLDQVALHSPAQRRAAIDKALSVIKYRNLQQREEALQTLRGALGDPKLPDDLMMGTAQLRRLHQAGMEIGGHTVRHPILRALPDDEAEREIRDGRARLEALIDAPVTSFAYPNGGPDRDYDLRHVAMVKAAGFTCAVSTARGVVAHHADRYQLPRFSPWDRRADRWVMRLLLKRLGSPAHQAATIAAA